MVGLIHDVRETLRQAIERHADRQAVAFRHSRTELMKNNSSHSGSISSGTTRSRILPSAKSRAR